MLGTAAVAAAALAVVVVARVELAVDVVGHIAGPDVGGVDDGSRQVRCKHLHLVLLLFRWQVEGRCCRDQAATALLDLLAVAADGHVVKAW